MTKRSLRASSIARRLIVLAYRSGPQDLTFEELSRGIHDQSLEGTKLRTRTALITLHSGGTKLAMGCRIHHGRDIFGGATVIAPAAVGQGHIQIMDDAIILPEGRLPAALVTRTAGRLHDKERIALGEVLSLDERIDATPITHIGHVQIGIRIGIDTVWTRWDAIERNTVAEIEAP